MRIALLGQQAFGKAVLEAFLRRGDVVAAVFCAPDDVRPDPLCLAAEAAGIPTHQFPKLSSPQALEAMRAADADLGVMAYVTQFVSQELCTIPRHGTIQFHPSLLPLHRGASSMSWSIVLGRAETGFSIFRPTDGLDEGPVILQRKVVIEPEDTLGTVYFSKIFPLGVAGLIEAAELVIAGKGPAVAQHEPGASYEAPIGDPESQIHWASHVDLIHNLIRGCDPAPGAWTTHNGRRLYLFDARKRVARTFAEIKSRRHGEIASCTDELAIHASGGTIIASRVRWQDGKKIAASQSGLNPGEVLGS